jgi:hypothetical protein
MDVLWLIKIAASVSTAMQAFLAGLKKNGKLLTPEQPASAFVKMVESGIPKALNGKTVNWDVVLETV